MLELATDSQPCGYSFLSEAYAAAAATARTRTIFVCSIFHLFCCSQREMRGMHDEVVTELFFLLLQPTWCLSSLVRAGKTGLEAHQCCGGHRSQLQYYLRNFPLVPVGPADCQIAIRSQNVQSRLYRSDEFDCYSSMFGIGRVYAIPQSHN